MSGHDYYPNVSEEKWRRGALSNSQEGTQLSSRGADIQTQAEPQPRLQAFSPSREWLPHRGGAGDPKAEEAFKNLSSPILVTPSGI